MSDQPEPDLASPGDAPEELPPASDGPTPEATPPSSDAAGASDRQIAQEAALADALEAHEDLLEAAPYLADEFVLWLWYRSERDFTTFHLTNGDSVDVWIDDRLAFASSEESKSVSTFKGGAPSTLPEARLSILSGRRIQEVGLGMRRGEAEWSFGLKVRPGELLITGLKIPAVVKDGVEEMIYERMYLIDAVCEVLGDLFAQYFRLRADPQWEDTERAALHGWLRGEVD